MSKRDLSVITRRLTARWIIARAMYCALTVLITTPALALQCPVSIKCPPGADPQYCQRESTRECEALKENSNQDIPIDLITGRIDVYYEDSGLPVRSVRRAALLSFMTGDSRGRFMTANPH